MVNGGDYINGDTFDIEELGGKSIDIKASREEPGYDYCFDERTILHKGKNFYILFYERDSPIENDEIDNSDLIRLVNFIDPITKKMMGDDRRLDVSIVLDRSKEIKKEIDIDGAHRIVMSYLILEELKRQDVYYRDSNEMLLAISGSYRDALLKIRQ